MRKLSLATVLMLFVLHQPVLAQFEGTIEFSSYEVKGDERTTDDDDIMMYITPERMLLTGSKSYKMAGALKAEGILVRMNEQDFVFLTGDDQAMTISKDGIVSMMNMFGGSSKKNNDNKTTFERTNETKTIDGYSARKFIATNTRKPNERAEVWMTDELEINWGMLAEPWGENIMDLAGDEVPMELIFDDGFFPLEWNVYEDGALTSEIKASVTAGSVSPDKVDLPRGVEAVSLQDYLFRQMQKQ